MISNISGKSFTAFGRGWAKIWGKSRGGIWLLPGDTSATVVQLSPNFKINALLPPKIRTAQADFSNKKNPKSFELKTPSLIWSQTFFHKVLCSGHPWCVCSNCKPWFREHHFYCFCDTCLTRGKKDFIAYSPKLAQILFHFHLYGTSEGRDRIFASPFRLANSDSSGKVCFGTKNFPVNLKQANNIYWSAPFNNDYNLTKPHHARCAHKIHRLSYEHFTQHKSQNSICRRKVEHKCNCPDKVNSIHLISCYCYSVCRCPCICTCCKAECACVCNCTCCTNTCACPCVCDLNNEFVQILQQAASNFYGGTDYTQFLCGDWFLSTSQPTDAIFISFEPELLQECKKSTVKIGESSALVGFAKRSADGQWIIDLQKETIALEDTEVYVL